MNFSENLTRVFSKPENDYEGFKQFLADYTAHKKIYDADGNVVPSEQANKKINSVCLDILGFEEGYKPTRKEIRRAMKRHGMELFEVLEDAIDFKVATGWDDNEFFNNFVEKKNLAQGDRNDFWSEKDVILTVARVSGSHHDLTMQKLGEGETVTVPTSNYGIKVGMDIDVYLTGRKDWSQFVDAVAIAFQEVIQNDIYAAFIDSENKMPTKSQFVKNMELTKANKETFDALISDVETANREPVVIMGLKTDLKKLTALADVDWISEGQKEEVAALGRLGSYEGTTLMEIPQRFVKNDVTKKLITPGTLYILPNIDNRFVKFVDVGDTEIVDVTEKGERNDDFMTYEVQREMGVAVMLDRYHGIWKIA